MVAHRLQALLARRRLEHAVALAGQVEIHQIGDVRFVVDDEDGAAFHDSMVARWGRAGREPRVSGT